MEASNYKAPLNAGHYTSWSQHLTAPKPFRYQPQWCRVPVQAHARTGRGIIMKRLPYLRLPIHTRIIQDLPDRRVRRKLCASNPDEAIIDGSPMNRTEISQEWAVAKADVAACLSQHPSRTSFDDIFQRRRGSYARTIPSKRRFGGSTSHTGNKLRMYSDIKVAEQELRTITMTPKQRVATDRNLELSSPPRAPVETPSPQKRPAQPSSSVKTDTRITDPDVKLVPSPSPGPLSSPRKQKMHLSSTDTPLSARASEVSSVRSIWPAPSPHERPLAPTPSRWEREQPTPTGTRFEISFDFGSTSPSFSSPSWLRHASAYSKAQRRKSEPLMRSCFKAQPRRKSCLPREVAAPSTPQASDVNSTPRTCEIKDGILNIDARRNPDIFRPFTLPPNTAKSVPPEQDARVTNNSIEPETSRIMVRLKLPADSDLPSDSVLLATDEEALATSTPGLDMDPPTSDELENDPVSGSPEAAEGRPSTPSPFKDSPGRDYMREFIKRSKPRQTTTTHTGSPVARTPLGARSPNVGSPNKPKSDDAEFLDPVSPVKKSPKQPRPEIDTKTRRSSRIRKQKPKSSIPTAITTTIKLGPNNVSAPVAGPPDVIHQTRMNTRRNKGKAEYPAQVLAKISDCDKESGEKQVSLEDNPLEAAAAAAASQALKRVEWRTPLESHQVSKKKKVKMDRGVSKIGKPRPTAAQRQHVSKMAETLGMAGNGTPAKPRRMTRSHVKM